MTTPNALAAGLGQLTQWLSAPAGSFERGFERWAVELRFRVAGLFWPDHEPQLVRVYDAGQGVVGVGTLPAEAAIVAATLDAGAATVVHPLDKSPGRLYARFRPPEGKPGLLYVERPAQPWAEAERQFVALSAQVMAHSPGVRPSGGTRPDAERYFRRLADASEICARMVHNFAGVVQATSCYSGYARDMLPADAPVQRHLGLIVAASDRGRELIDLVTRLNKSHERHPQPTTLAAALATLTTALGLSPESLPALGRELPPAAIGPGPLGLVLEQLLKNALESVPAARPVECDALVLEVSPEDAGGYFGAVGQGPHLAVTIRDFGPGISPKFEKHLLVNPFHTTKVRHHGLGLAMATRALAAHRGGLRLDPQSPGVLATAVIPLAPETLPVVGTRPSPRRNSLLHKVD